MGSAVGSDAAAGGLAGPGAGGIVSRPRLFGRLGASARVTVVSASPGSGKTVLLRSWISQAGEAGGVAWVTVRRGERDPQQFWLSVLGALRRTAPGRALIQPLTAAPDLDGWAIAERLLTDLAPLRDRVHLVIDDLHELGPAEAQRQLELLMMRAPAELRFVLATRHDVRLGLHRLRLEGELAEIREPDLRFTVPEAGELFNAAGVKLPDPAPLVERTEGWAAGLRLAALSLAGHPDPRGFAEEFSGTERTVAEYLLAEVLDRQPEPVRRLLLRTSVLERVNGELADLLTGGAGGERVLQDLEQANAFVVALDTRRSWFRYHHLFADLLHLELRRTVPGEVTALHRAAAGWLAGHGYPADAVRHAQAAADWGPAARLLADSWYSLQLDGQAATARQLLAAFPAGTRTADAELAALSAAEELAYGSLEAAERYLGLAERAMASVPAARRAQAQLLLGITRLVLARQRWNLQAVAEEERQLQAVAEVPHAAQPQVGEELRALALISLGTTEFWASGEDPERHLEMGVALARRIGRPFLEFTGLAYQTAAGIYQSFTRAAERGERAIELARRHGWADEPAAGLAYVILAAMLAWQMRPGEAEPWVQRAERVLRAETEPAAVLAMYQTRTAGPRPSSAPVPSACWHRPRSAARPGFPADGGARAPPSRPGSIASMMRRHLTLLAASMVPVRTSCRSTQPMRSKPMILAALLLAAFLVNLDTTLVNVALPAMVRELRATTTQLQWVVDAYNLVFAALLLTFGSLSDRFGRKGTLLAGLAVVGAASLAGGFTASPVQLIAARAVMGLGAAMTFPATLSLISNVFTERKERARAIGLWGAIAGVAIATGPIVGGWLLERYSWEAIFIAMAPVAAAAAALAALAVPASRDPEAAAVDVPGLVLSSAAMALLVFTVIEAPGYGWAAARSLSGFAASAALLAAFIAWERRAAHPMLDVALFRNMRFSAASGAVTVSFFTLFGFIFLVTQYFQFVRGYGPLSTGVRLLPVALSVGAGSVCGTQLAVRAGTKLVVTTGLVAMAAFYGWITATISTTLSYDIIAAQMVVYGLGLGLTSAPATESIMGAIPLAKAGVGSAINDSTRLIGGTLGVAVIGSVYASVYASRLSATMPAGVPAPAAAVAHQSVGAAYAAAGTMTARGDPALGLALYHASTNAFLRGLIVGALVAGSAAAAGAFLAAWFLPAQPARPASPAVEEAAMAGRAHRARPVPAPPDRPLVPRPAIEQESAERKGNHD